MLARSRAYSCDRWASGGETSRWHMRGAHGPRAFEFELELKMTGGEGNERYRLENAYLICGSCTFSELRGERGSDKQNANTGVPLRSGPAVSRNRASQSQSSESKRSVFRVRGLNREIELYSRMSPT